MEEELSLAIESGKEGVSSRDDPKLRAKVFSERFGWDKTEATKIWAYGPEQTGANLLVDATKGVQYLNEIKDSCVASLQWVTKEGPCAEEKMRGVRFNILDVTVSPLSTTEAYPTLMPVGSFIPMPSIVVVDKSSPHAVVSATPLPCSPSPACRSQSTSVRPTSHPLLPRLTACFRSRDSMSRERYWRYLLDTEQASWTRYLGRATPGYPYVHRQGLPSCQRVVRFHCRSKTEHARTGLPAIRFRSLGVDARILPRQGLQGRGARHQS